MSTNIQNIANKKIIAKLFLHLSDYKKVKFIDLCPESDIIEDIYLPNYRIELDSIYKYNDQPNYIDGLLESIELVSIYFEIIAIKAVYHEDFNDELTLTAKQKDLLKNILEKAVRFEFGINKNTNTIFN